LLNHGVVHINPNKGCHDHQYRGTTTWCEMSMMGRLGTHHSPKLLCSGEVKVSILTCDQNQTIHARYTNMLLQLLISLYYKQAFSAIRRYLGFKLATELSNSCTNCWTAWPADDRLCPSKNIRDHSHHLVLSLYLMISQIQCHPNKNKNNSSDFQNITEHSWHLT
jgi:hypothetical protein